MRMHAPMLVPLTGLIAGICASLSGASLITAGVLTIAACLIYFLLISLSVKPVIAFRINKYHYIWVFLIFSAIGLFTTDINKPWDTDNSEQFIAARAHVESVSHSTRGDNLTVKVSQLIKRDGKTARPHNLKILLHSDAVEADVDDDIYFPVYLSKIVNSDNYFKSGYAESMKRNGIIYETKAEGKDITTYSHQTTLKGLAYVIRCDLEEFIEKTPLAKETQDFLITILLGDRSYLDREVRGLYADAGISHILALSGMHVAIISGIILWLLFPLNFFGHYRLRLGISLAILYFYAFITGFSPSTLRATLMMTSVLLCILLERKNSSWDSLLTATFLILAFNPYALTDIGLQLSFLSVASLIFFVNPCIPFDRHEHPGLYKISALAVTTLSATLGTWCISAYYFGSVPFMFLPANMLILPVLPIYLVIAIIYLFCYASGLDIKIIGELLDAGIRFMNNTIDHLTNSGNSAVMFSPSILSVIIWICLAVCIAIWLNGKKSRLSKYSCFILAGCFAVSVVFSSDADNEDSFIIQKGADAVHILSRTNGREHLNIMDRYSISHCQIAGHKILTIDTSTDSPDISIPSNTYDEVIIAGGCREDLTDILSRISPRTIVIHPSVRRKREKKIIETADSLGINCHSIRRSGAYRPDIKNRR